MAQARREPRFSEIELLPPTPGARMTARGADDIIDAEFESLLPGVIESAFTSPARGIGAIVPGLGILRRDSGAHAAPNARQAAITPGFAAFTLLSALAVFWLCGGHALLY